MATDSVEPNYIPYLKPFHARIFRPYILYCRDILGWSDNEINRLLQDVGTDLERINSDKTWFDLSFADRFYFALEDKTGDEKLAYHAGRYMKKSLIQSAVYLVARGLIGISKFYTLIGSYTAHFTKAARLEVIEMGYQFAIIESIPELDGHERKYMCENRKGILEAIPQVFGLPYAVVNEKQCYHEGAKSCRYEVLWQEATAHRVVFTSVSVSALAFIASFYFFDHSLSFLVGLSVSLMSFLLLSTRIIVRQKRDLAFHNQILDKAITDLDKRNSELNIVSEISRMTHSSADPKRVAEAIVQQVCALLGYDRALLLLVDPARNTLYVNSQYGFDETTHDLLKDAEFNIRSDNTTGFFIKVVNTKSPIIIENVASHIEELSPRSQRFAKILGATSFVAVPLMNAAAEVIGVLSVDYVNAEKKMGLSDQDLLMTMADHLAIAIHNANSMEQLTKSLESLRVHSEHQHNVSRVFRKFIPTDLSENIMTTTDTTMQRRLLESVRKRTVAIMFGDIFNFSTLVKDFEPEDTIKFLNLIFGKIEPIIREHSGFVDKFTGDGFMAIFEDSESCQSAAKAAAAIIQCLDEINMLLREVGFPEISFGIGLHYGSVILGNVGSSERLNFTVIGEAVNLASRLESYTRNLGPNRVCTSAAIKYQCQDLFQWEPLGAVSMKGYENGVEAFELIVPKASINQPGNLIQFPKPTKGS